MDAQIIAANKIETKNTLYKILNFVERVGKGIRTAPRDSLVAGSSEENNNAGLNFGFHKAMDNSGAIVGPLTVAAPGRPPVVIVAYVSDGGEVEYKAVCFDREPEAAIRLVAPARRVTCFRMDKPVGDRQFQVPFGQYALRLRSSVPVVAQIGRADVRQPNLSYYTTMGYGQ